MTAETTPHVWIPGERKVTIAIPNDIFAEAVNAEIADVLAFVRKEAMAYFFASEIGEDGCVEPRAVIDVDLNLGGDAAFQFNLVDILLDRVNDFPPSEPGYALCVDLLRVLAKHGVTGKTDPATITVRELEVAFDRLKGGRKWLNE